MAVTQLIPIMSLVAAAAFAQAGVGGGGRPAIPASLSGTEKSVVHIAGKVTLEDGSPPPFPAVIERLCNGAFAEGQTDAKGAFSLDLGHDAIHDPLALRTSMEMDPAEPDHPYSDCRIRANLPGYRSDVVSMATAKPAGRPYLGTIVLHFLAVVDGHILSPTSQEAPKDAKKAFDRAQESARKRETDAAVKEYQKAVQIDPGYAVAWYELGRLQMAAHQFDAAGQSFDAAMKADPKFLSPLLPRASIALNNQSWPELAEVTTRLMRLDAFDYPEAYYYNAVANYNLKKMREAEESVLAAQRLDPQHRFPDAYRLLASILVARDQIPQACEQLSSFLKNFPNDPDAATVREQLDRLQKIAAPTKK